MHATAPPRHLGVCRLLGVVLEEFLQPLAAALSHDARVPPPASGAGSGRDEGDGLRGLGEGLGARLDLIAAVTAGFLARHGLALPSLRALVDVMVHEYSGKSQMPSHAVVHQCPSESASGSTRDGLRRRDGLTMFSSCWVRKEDQ
jgi:hypothetical protein